MRVHLDTDFGGDVDDVCALAMLLGWPGVELVGLTTVADDRGRRAGQVRRALELAGRPAVPIAAGVDVAAGRYPYPLGLPPEAEYWGGVVPPLPGPVEDAVELLRRSVDAGAVVVAIGPLSNLAELEARHPGSLARAQLVVMGGYVYPPRPGFPVWGAADDFNVQVDVAAAEVVLAHATPTLVPLSVTAETVLRRADLPRLRAAGPLGARIAHQAEWQARDEQTEARWGRTCPNLPDDTLSFLHDPLAAAVAVGWRQGVTIETLPLVWERRGGILSMRAAAGGKPMPLVVGVDAPAFAAEFLGCVERAASPSATSRD